MAQTDSIYLGKITAGRWKSGAPHRFNEEIAEAEYESLLEDMRKEKDGINDWLMRGNLAWILRHSDPKGSAWLNGAPNAAEDGDGNES